MTLIPCHECNEKVSTEADRCQQCGARVEVVPIFQCDRCLTTGPPKKKHSSLKRDLIMVLVAVPLYFITCMGSAVWVILCGVYEALNPYNCCHYCKSKKLEVFGFHDGKKLYKQNGTELETEIVRSMNDYIKSKTTVIPFLNIFIDDKRPQWAKDAMKDMDISEEELNELVKEEEEASQ